MKIVYLSSAFPDIVWMRLYYRSIFPQGSKRALEKLLAVERLIAENPEIGRAFSDVREFPILRTPFIVIYRQRAGIIEILRVWDARRDPADLQF